MAKFILYRDASINLVASFSLIQRLCGIIYLIHGVIASYRSKHLFLVEEEQLTREFRQYISRMSLFSMGAVLVFWIVNWLIHLDLNDYVIFALFFSAMFTCFNSFLELYFNRMNRPHFVLIITIIYSLFYYVCLLFIPYNPVSLSSLILFSAIFSVLMTIGLIKYIKPSSSYVRDQLNVSI
jgi:hypothetical protein